MRLARAAGAKVTIGAHRLTASRVEIIRWNRDSERSVVRTIKLMPDYRCWPLWEASPGEVGNIDPDTLLLSSGLKELLLAWSLTYDATLNWADPMASPPISDEEQARFEREGAALAELLRDELGPTYSVILQC